MLYEVLHNETLYDHHVTMMTHSNWWLIVKAACLIIMKMFASSVIAVCVPTCPFPEFGRLHQISIAHNPHADPAEQTAQSAHRDPGHSDSSDPVQCICQQLHHNTVKCVSRARSQLLSLCLLQIPIDVPMLHAVGTLVCRMD